MAKKKTDRLTEKGDTLYLWKMLVETVTDMVAKKQKERRISVGRIIIGKKPKKLYMTVALPRPLRKKVKKTVYFVPEAPMLLSDICRPKVPAPSGHNKIPT